MLDVTSTQGLSLILDFEESDKTISEGGNHVGLKLMHGNGHTLFLRYYELKQEFTVEHVPEFDYTILTTACDRVILIELMKAL